MNDLIVAKACSRCTRVLPIERFRLRTHRTRLTPFRVAQCDQCESGREAARWANRHSRPKPKTPEQMVAEAFNGWRYPTERDNPLRWAA